MALLFENKKKQGVLPKKDFFGLNLFFLKLSYVDKVTFSSLLFLKKKRTPRYWNQKGGP